MANKPLDTSLLDRAILFAAFLICGAIGLTSCLNDNRSAKGRPQGENPAVVTEVNVTPSQSRVGYSAWNTQVSYTHCDPLPKTGKPEMVSGSWEINDGILQHKASEEAPLAICNYVIPSNRYTIQCTARKDSGPDGFIIVFNYVDEQNYCQLNYGCKGNTKHAIEQISGNKRKQLATHSGSIETGKWYNVKLTVAGDSIKAWLDSELMFDEVFK